MNNVNVNSTGMNNSSSSTTRNSVGNQRNRKWTEQDDIILLEKIKESPNNLSVAFLAASEVLNRSALACSNHWYTSLSKKEGKDNVVFMCVSKSKIGRNRKNCGTELTNSTNRWKQIWGSIISFFK